MEPKDDIVQNKSSDSLKIESAFSKLDEQKDRFLQNERAYRSQYEKGTDGETTRTTKQKASDRKRSKMYIPLTKTTVDIIHSLFKTSFMGVRCPIEVEGIGQNDEKLKNAILSEVKRQWSNPSHKVGLNRGVLSAISQPLGNVALFWDAQRQEIRTKYVPITDLAYDELASDIFDTEHCCRKWKISVREFEDNLASGFYSNVEEASSIYPEGSSSSTRIEMKEIYVLETEGGVQQWKMRCYANNHLVRTTTFSRKPFHSGYCLETLPSIDIGTRDKELQFMGSCVPELVREIQTEYNIKRNQKIDMIENIIDPMWIVGDKSAISISDISSRKKYVRALVDQGQKLGDVITPMPQPSSTYQLTEEINMLDQEYQKITGVNSVLLGHTSPADRRAMGALQTVNAASSMRIESMMQTLLDTMLQSYAEHFVELVWMYTPDDVFTALMEDESIIDVIGKQGKRKALNFDIRVNFGTTIANETKMSQLNSLLQILVQTQHANPAVIDQIVGRIYTLIMGESANPDDVKTPHAQEQPQELSPEEKQRQALAGGGV